MSFKNSNKSRLSNQPKYRIGEAVVVKISGLHKETETLMEQDLIAFISCIKASGTSDKDTYEYGITIDIPGAYHNGKKPFVYLYEDDIVLADKPSDVLFNNPPNSNE